MDTQPNTWGNPGKNATNIQKINYSNQITKLSKEEQDSIDLVLIDGRFRVACFLTTLRYANPKTKIYFDDYLTRPFYHEVEEFEVPIEETTRAAVFIVNGSYDIEKLDYLINKFEYVFD